MIMATETVSHSNGNTSQVIVAGGAFMSNFEIRNSTVDNISDLYSNQNIVINLIQSLVDVKSVAGVKQMTPGTIVTVEGIATSNIYSGNNATNTGFFDCIYVQDSTGGINLFPVSAGVTEGQKIRVTGTVSSYQGEIQLQVRKLQIVDTAVNSIVPTALSTAEAMAPENTGLLVQVSGVVSNVITSGGTVSEFILTDATGVGALIYINAYITSDVDLSFIADGARVSVTGLASIGENASGSPLPRIRVRDRSEIVLLAPSHTCDFVLSARSSSTNLQNNTTVTITVDGKCECGDQKVMASASVKLKQSGTQTVKVGDYTVTVVVNGNNKITSITVGSQTPPGGGNSQGGNSQGGNSQGGNSQGGNSQGGNSQGGNSQ